MNASSGDPAAQPRSTTDLDSQLCFALYAATNAIVRAYRPMLDRLGLTYPQYLIMLALWHEGTQQIGDLAARLNLSPSAVSPLVERMAKAGLVVRRRAEHDRRVVTVEVTEAGQALEAAVGEIQERVSCRTGLDTADFAALREQLHRLGQRMSGPAPA